MDDVIVHKAAIIERCLKRVLEEHAGDDANLRHHLTRQDSIVLNLQRACEAAIDLAMHLVRLRRLGVPQDSRDAFTLLVRAGHLDADLGRSLQNMVGFRNIAVHQYDDLDLDVVSAIIRGPMTDLERFARGALKPAGPSSGTSS